FRVIAQFCRKYVVKRWLSAKEQNGRFAVFPQNCAVLVSEFVRKLSLLFDSLRHLSESLRLATIFPGSGTTESQVWETERGAKDVRICLSDSRIGGYV